MDKRRKIKKVLKSNSTVEGAGVHLKRAFGFNEVPMFDPFLLLDDFRPNNREEYIKGFPWHPHRGIETITYVLKGEVEHGDSMGNRGVISSGDVQWMTSGSGIIHQEMPEGNVNGLMQGFQLWANLPSSNKMINPRYQNIKSEQIPVLTLDNGVKIRVICGSIDGKKGPVQDIIIDPEYLDVTVPAHSSYTHLTEIGQTVFAYVIDGKGCFYTEENPFTDTDNDKEINFYDIKGEPLIGDESIVLFDDGEEISVLTKNEHVRFLLISGEPINEPVAWYGPIVMNTQEELEIAFEEYHKGTFIKHKK